MWGMFATLRRMLSIVALFVPSLGLFSVLHHWQWEQIPFRTRLNFSKRPGFKISPDDKITLLGLNETIYWSELDRWDYSGEDPAPPPYSIYTLLTLRETFIAGAVLCCVHFLFVVLVKALTSEEFRRPEQFVNKFIHVLENLNYATPFSDWDEGGHSVEMFRKRFRATCKEMTATFCVNMVSTGLCMVPLWYMGKEKSYLFNFVLTFVCFNSAYQVEKRHSFLRGFIGVKRDEEVSYENMQVCLITMTACVVAFCALEIGAYFLYSHKVRY